MALPLAVAPFIVAAVAGGFASGIVQGIIKAALAFGIGYAVYQGLDVLIQGVVDSVIVNLNSLPSAIVGALGLLKVDKCINVLSSAFFVRLILKGVTNGVVTKLEIKE